MTNDFLDKTVLVTGATKGLGAELAKHFWQLGANLLLLARSQDLLAKLRDELYLTKSTHQQIEIFSVNLACQDQTEKFIQKIQPKNIDILINNAAIQGPIGSVWENDWKEWQETLQVNLLSPVALCRAIVPNMLRQKHGKVINLSGGGAASARPQFSAYAVAKAGLVRFSEILAEEVKSFHVDVNCVAPGMMNTELLNEIVKAGHERAGMSEYSRAKQEIENKNNSFLNVTQLCSFLASPQSNGMTGKLISAVWDPWQTLENYMNELKESDIYTLRRIIPSDRGKKWGDE